MDLLASNSQMSSMRGITAILCGWLLAQTLKVLWGAWREKRINFRWFLWTGGMPSTHSAAVASASTVTGMYYGFDSVIFMVVLVFSLIIMFDAAGVRRAVGKQASILNTMVEDMYKGQEVGEKKLKELLGHTPFEVLAGAAFGIIVSLIVCLI